MNDRSPRLPLNYKYLQLLSFLQNEQLIPLRVTVERFILGPGWRIFRPTVLEFDARLGTKDWPNFERLPTNQAN